MIVCIAEKPSVARDIADVLGAREKKDGYIEGNGYQVTWTFGHLCTLKEPHEYTPDWKSWRLEYLPMIPPRFGIKLISNPTYERQFHVIEGLMQKADMIINCGDAGQEGELIQRWVMQKAGARCPVKRLWISSLTEEAIREGKPAGLRHFGDWKTIYEALPHLPEEVKKSWFAFDHYYSDHSFSEALAVLMRRGGKNILDVGGNTGRFALEAVAYDKDVQVTVMDLPGQIEMMRKAVAGSEGSGRIHAYPADLLDEGTVFPSGFDKIWMSQFLDCFGTEEVVSILSRAAASMSEETELYIMESFWDRQPYGTAAFALTAISLYFTVMANGNSKMYGYSDMLECVERAGLKVDERIDNVGKCHTILICSKKQ